MQKLTDEEWKWIGDVLTTMMTDESDPDTQAVIALCYENFPKEVADSLVTLARATAAGDELAKKIQSDIWTTTGAKFGGRA
jgi:hypothetical protein